MEYRREIDGLRAVAIIPVILYHAGVEAFSGGFVGVDVFFVISGFLITSIILQEKEQGTFSLVNFYERRARRILPALYLVMFVCLPFAWMWLQPRFLKEFSLSLVSVSVFASNILFMNESGYFATASETKPLLNTWSLGVEEQYYLLFPLFLMFLWKLRKHWISVTFIAVGLFSLVLAQWGSQTNPVVTFFILPTRAWELMVGASISYFIINNRRPPNVLVKYKLIYELMGVIGFSLIVYAVFTFDESLQFPSSYTLIPTVGAALIILFTTSGTFSGRVLGSKALVGIGLISYSAYLWHWPLFVFSRHRSLTEHSQAFYLMLSILTIALSYLSWRYIEKPFRKKDIVSRRMVFGFGAIGCVVFILIGMIGYLANGFDNRSAFDGSTMGEIEYKLRVNHGLSKACSNGFNLSPDCRTSNDPEIMVWGDSLAMHLIQGILSSNPSAKIIQMTKSGCAPFFGAAIITKELPPTMAKECLEFNENVRNWLRLNKSIKFVVLSSPYSWYLSDHPKLLIRDKQINATLELLLQQFFITAEEIERMGARLIVFSPPPFTSKRQNIGNCLAKASFLKINLDVCDFIDEEIPYTSNNLFHFFSQVENKYPVVWLTDLLCRYGECSSHFGSIFVYRDGVHLSHEGSSEIGRRADFFGLITRRN